MTEVSRWWRTKPNKRDSKMSQIHNCGGQILDGGDHSYCDHCRAFAYDDAPVPSGTSQKANRKAWDDGDASSPDAVPVHKRGRSITEAEADRMLEAAQ